MKFNIGSFVIGAVVGGILVSLAWLGVGTLLNPKRLEAAYDLATGHKKPSGPEMESMLRSDLQTVRSQLELYKVQHLEKYPPQETFVQQLTSRTDGAGNVKPVGGKINDFPFGPYLQQFPDNPFVEDEAAAKKIKFGEEPCPCDGTTGWYFDLTTGKLSANDAGHKDM